jgi:hypothetical protein
MNHVSFKRKGVSVGFENARTFEVQNNRLKDILTLDVRLNRASA